VSHILSQIKDEITAYIRGKTIEDVKMDENGKWWDFVFSDGTLTIEVLSSPPIPVMVWRKAPNDPSSATRRPGPEQKRE
jgi:hypothetical protein